MTKIFCAAFLCVAVAAVQAQQYNTFTASMMFDGLSGPPVPVVFACSRGLPHTVTIQGLPWSPFIVYGSPTMLTAGIYLGGPGVVDINPVGYYTLFNGLVNAIFNTGATGTWNAPFTLSGTTALNMTQSYQTLMADVSAPTGARLTMATKLVVSHGLTVVNAPLGDNDSYALNLSTYGMSIPYYAANYSTMYISGNGYASFTGADDDFTPTTSEFNSLYPRIAAKWTDLHPELGGSVNIQINQAATPPTVQVNWVNLPEWASNGFLHTFSVRVFSQIGDIDIIHGAGSPPVASYDSITGITAGNGLGPNTGTQKNLSGFYANPLQGAANENFHEWNGIVGMTYYTPTPYVSNPFDLTGRTLTFYGVGVGATGGSYFATCTQ
ncbi:MAG: hypothetical protein EXS14_03070 [Planctomycetes bacterium]|nr:hypothetical protein [Planctomycetota bacterium]